MLPTPEPHIQELVLAHGSLRAYGTTSLPSNRGMQYGSCEHAVQMVHFLFEDFVHKNYRDSFCLGDKTTFKKYSLKYVHM